MNDNLIESIPYKGYEIEVYYDDSDQSPDEWGDDELFLVYDHRDFCIKRKGFLPRDIFDTEKDMYSGYYVFPVYAYIHSGVSLSLGRSRYPFNDRWDVSSTGYALVKREKGCWNRDKAYKLAELLIKEWNQYLSGDVYGYCSEIGGCSGFYGEEGKEEMIKEAKSEIDYHIQEETKKRIKSHNEQLKIWIKNKVPLYVRKSLELTI
jgi:hypothetical protein